MTLTEFQSLLLQEFPKGSRDTSHTMGQRRVSLTGGALKHLYTSNAGMSFIQKLRSHLPPDAALYNFDGQLLKEWPGIVGYGSDLHHIRFISRHWEPHTEGEKIPEINADSLAYAS